jgi:hypothetical protein
VLENLIIRTANNADQIFNILKIVGQKYFQFTAACFVVVSPISLKLKIEDLVACFEQQSNLILANVYV